MNANDSLKKTKERLLSYRADMARYRQLVEELSNVKRLPSMSGLDYDRVMAEKLVPVSPVEQRLERIEQLEYYIKKLRSLLKPVARFVHILSNPDNSIALQEMYQLVKLHYIGGCNMSEVSRRTLIHRNTLSRRNKTLVRMARDYLYPTER